MTANHLLNTILKEAYTQTMLNHRLSILKAYLLQNLFGGSQKLLWQQADLSWLKSLPPGYLQNFSKDNVYQIFTELDQQKLKLKPLTIYLAFEPDDSSINLIGTMARKMFADSLILDLKYDPNLIAGAALVWKGIYRDYSLRSQIEQKKTEILQSFKKFLR